MEEEKRDELLIRIDERQKQILELNVRQEKHLSDLNSKVNLNVIKLVSHDGRLASIDKILEIGIPLRLTKKQYAAGGGSLLTILATLMLAVGKALGWF